MIFDHLFQDVPHNGLLLLHHLFGLLDGSAVSGLLKAVVNKRFEQLQRHLLGQTALVQLKFGAYDDHRATGVIHALAEKVLAEAALLAFQGVRERFQGTVIGAAQHASTAAIVKQRVHGFLQHALFIAHDHLRSMQIHQLLQAVVAVNYAPIQIVEI